MSARKRNNASIIKFPMLKFENRTRYLRISVGKGKSHTIRNTITINDSVSLKVLFCLDEMADGYDFNDIKLWSVNDVKQ